MLVLVIAGKSRSKRESAARCLLVSETMVVSALEHCVHRRSYLAWQLADPSSTLGHTSHHRGNFGLVDVVSGACAFRLQQARNLLTPA